MKPYILFLLNLLLLMTSFQYVTPNFKITNKNSSYKIVVKNIDDVDFKNLSYTFTNNLNYKLVNGSFYQTFKPFGFDKVTLLNIFTIHADKTKYKLIELERHYGGGSSNILNYLIAFTVKDTNLIMTSQVEFIKAKNITVENAEIVLYSYRWESGDGHSSPSQIDRGLFSLKNGDMIIKSWTSETNRNNR